jgi:hypothetical protein
MTIAAPSMVSDATNLREVAAALRAFLAAKGGDVNRAFAANLEAIALEIDAAAHPSAAPDRSSLCVTAQRLSWFALCSDVPTADLLLRLAKEMEESAWRSGGPRAPLPTPQEAPPVAWPAQLEAKDGGRRATTPVRRSRLAGVARAMLAVLAIAVCGPPSPPPPRIAQAEKAVPASPRTPPAISLVAMPEPPVAATAPAGADAPPPPITEAEKTMPASSPAISAGPTPESPVAATAPTAADASPPRIAATEKTSPASPAVPPAISAAPTPESPVAAATPPHADASPPPAPSTAPDPVAEVAPRSSDAVAQPKPLANSEAGIAPTPRRAVRSAPIDETQSGMAHALAAAGTGTEVPPPAPPSPANTQPARGWGMEASAPAKPRRAARPEPADEARTLMLRELARTGGAGEDAVPPAPGATPAPPPALPGQ